MIGQPWEDPLPFHIAQRVLRNSGREIRRNREATHVRVYWKNDRGEDIAFGLFIEKRQCVRFAESKLTEHGYTSGKFFGSEARGLEDLGKLISIEIDDEE